MTKPEKSPRQWPPEPKKSRKLLDQKLISLKFLAEQWDVSRATVSRRLDAAGIRPFYIGGDARNATLRYSAADVEEFLRRCRAP